MALRYRRYKLRNRMGLEKGSDTEPLDLCIGKISSLRADVTKLQEAVGSHIRNLRTMYASGASVARAFETFFDKDADAAHPCVLAIGGMYRAGVAGPPLTGELEHTTDTIQGLVSEPLERWLREISDLEKRLETLKKSELRKRHDYYTKKVETLTSHWEAMSANDQSVPADSALDEKLDRNTKKLSDAAKAYYTALDMLSKQTEEMMESAEAYLQALLEGLCLPSELLFAALHRLAIKCSDEACRDAGEDVRHRVSGAQDMIQDVLDGMKKKTPKACEGPMQRKGWVSSTELLCTLRGQHCLLYSDPKACSEGKRPLLSLRLDQVDVDGFVDDLRPGGFRLVGTANTEDMSEADLEALEEETEGGKWGAGWGVGRGGKKKGERKVRVTLACPRADRKRHGEWSQALQSASSWSHGVVSTKDLGIALQRSGDFALASRSAMCEMQKEEQARKDRAYKDFQTKTAQASAGKRKSMGALMAGGDRWSRQQTFDSTTTTGPLDAPHAAAPPTNTPVVTAPSAPSVNPFTDPTSRKPPPAYPPPLPRQENPSPYLPQLPPPQPPTQAQSLSPMLQTPINQDERVDGEGQGQEDEVGAGAADGGENERGSNPFAKPGPPPPVPPRVSVVDFGLVGKKGHSGGRDGPKPLPGVPQGGNGPSEAFGAEPAAGREASDQLTLEDGQTGSGPEAADPSSPGEGPTAGGPNATDPPALGEDPASSGPEAVDLPNAHSTEPVRDIPGPSRQASPSDAAFVCEQDLPSSAEADILNPSVTAPAAQPTPTSAPGPTSVIALPKVPAAPGRKEEALTKPGQDPLACHSAAAIIADPANQPTPVALSPLITELVPSPSMESAHSPTHEPPSDHPAPPSIIDPTPNLQSVQDQREASAMNKQDQATMRGGKQKKTFGGGGEWWG